MKNIVQNKRISRRCVKKDMTRDEDEHGSVVVDCNILWGRKGTSGG
jgi:hypothetical protein